MIDKNVWYVSYGSNRNVERFLKYIIGGKAGSRDYTGCSDKTPPQAIRDIIVPYKLVFAGKSPVWGGGVAYLDISRTGVTTARAYMITANQFAEVVAQENHLTSLDLPTLLPGQVATMKLGASVPGRPAYDLLVCLPDAINGLPAFTFTAQPKNLALQTEPTPEYLALVTSN